MKETMFSQGNAYVILYSEICTNDRGFRLLEVHLSNLGYEVMIFTKNKIKQKLFLLKYS